jgi:hypothetical protein
VVPIGYAKAGLTAAEQQMIAKLADACHQMDEIYLHQSDLGGWAMYHTTQNEYILRLFNTYGSRWDLVDENTSILGEEPMMPGRELYPFGITKADIAQYAAAHPDAKAGLYSPFTVVRSAPLDLPAQLSEPVVRGTPDHLYIVPYHEAYAEWVKPLVADLRAAAKLSPDAAFAHYLNLRADAFLSDDYHASDAAWLELKSPKIDLIFAPRDTTLDGILGIKASYGGSILIRNEAESRKLAMYQQHEAAMQQALPIAAENKPAKDATGTLMEVADAPLRAGNLRYGFQTVAANLPNDPTEKGTKQIFFKNFVEARVENVILPVAQRVLTPAQAKDVSSEGYLTFTVLREISHGLGPASANVGGRQTAIGDAIGPGYGALEEAKADATGVFLAKWLVDQRLATAAELNAVYASYVAGMMRSLRLGAVDAQGRAEMSELNYLLEQNAIKQALASGAQAGKYMIDYAAMPGAVESLAKQLLTFEANGDRAGAEAWLAKYDVMPAAMTHALESTASLPVDITPDFEIAHGVRP